MTDDFNGEERAEIEQLIITADHPDHFPDDRLLGKLLESGQMPSHPVLSAPVPVRELWPEFQAVLHQHTQDEKLREQPIVLKIRCGSQDGKCRRLVGSVFDTGCGHGPLLYAYTTHRLDPVEMKSLKSEAGGKLEPYRELIADFVGDYDWTSGRWEMPLRASCPLHEPVQIDRSRLKTEVRRAMAWKPATVTLPELAQR